jgi:hypothetical protein
MWSQIQSALRNQLHTQQVESELDDEIASYVAAVTDEKIAAGLAPEEARRRALAECGGTEHVKQAVRNSRAGAFAESLRQDIRFGVRQLRRNPAFALHRNHHPCARHRRDNRNFLRSLRAIAAPAPLSAR